jgi:phage baseplate assembly protein W
LTRDLPRDLFGVDFAFDAEGDLIVSPSGQVLTIGGAANVKEAIIRRIGTALGESYKHPDYGSRLPDLVGEENDDVTWAKAVRTVKQALNLEPRVREITDVYTRAIDGNRFDVLAFYKLIDDDTPRNIVFPFYVR